MWKNLSSIKWKFCVSFIFMLTQGDEKWGDELVKSKFEFALIISPCFMLSYVWRRREPAEVARSRHLMLWRTHDDTRTGNVCEFTFSHFPHSHSLQIIYYSPKTHKYHRLSSYQSRENLNVMNIFILFSTLWHFFSLFFFKPWKSQFKFFFR